MKTTTFYKRLLIYSLILINITQLTAQVNFQWAKNISGSVLNPHITVDASGNVYTSTTFSGTVDFDPGAGIFNLTSNASEDVYIQKLDVNGNFIWARAFGNVNHEQLSALRVDASGNCYLVGRYRGTVDFDPNSGIYNLSSSSTVPFLSGFILKLDFSGNFVWAKSVADDVFGIEQDGSGNIYTCGMAYGIADLDPGTAVYNIGQNNAISYFILKLNSGGNFVWAKANTSNGTNVGLGTYYMNPIGIDQTGNVYVAGEFSGTWDFDPGSGIFNLTSSSSDKDIFIQKLDSNGNFIWAKNEGGNGADYFNSLSLDAMGNIYVLGNYSLTVDFDPGSGIANLTTTGNPNFIQKLDTNANLLWVKAVDDSIGVTSITIDNLGNLYLTGAYSTIADFDFGAAVVNISSNGSYDYFIQKVDSNSNLIWVKTFGSNMIDVGEDLIVDSQNNIYVAGFYTGTVDFDPNTGVSNLNSSNSTISDMFIHKLSQGPTGVDAYNYFLNVHVYPNPSTDHWNVILNNTNYKNGTLIVTDVNGKMILSVNLNNQIEKISIPNSTLSTGIYFLKIKTDNGYDIQKLIKQ